MTRLFTNTEIDGIGKHKVIYENDQMKANELIESGKATRLNIPKFDELERKANDLFEAHRKAIADIKASDNPLFTDEVKAYEIDKQEKEYRKQIAAFEEEYTNWRAEQIEEATTRAARAVFKATEKDREFAKQYITRASLNLATAADHEKNGVIDDLSKQITAHFTDGQKVAMQAEIGAILPSIGASQRNTLVAAVSDVHNDDTLALKVAQQLPNSVLTKQRQSDIVRQAVKDNELHTTDGMTREFYEEHIRPRKDGKGSDQ